jgi:uncharacterized membrane protein
MKKYFITGLVILLPLALTLTILIFMFNLLTQPFVGLVKTLFIRFHLFETGFLFFTADQIQQVISQIIILILLFFFTVTLGLVGRWFFFHYLIKFSDYLFHRIPFIRAVYKTCQDVINTIFTTDTKAFKQVVMVPFPNTETRSIGLVTRESIPNFENGEKTDLVAVFVPTTPNPTSGFLLLYKEEELVHLNMSVENALKYIISCGVITTPFNQISQEDLRKLKELNEEVL